MNMILISRKKTTKVFFAVIIASLFFVFSSASTAAQESLTLSISPSFFDNMSIEPGQEWRSSLRVINVNKFDLTVYLDVVNFLPQDESGLAKFTQVIPEESNGTTLAEWFILNKEPVLIPREQSVEVPIAVRVPSDATPGGHYAAVLVGTRPLNPVPGQAQVQTSSMVSSLFFARVAGDIHETGVIREFITTSKYLNTPEATFELRFENKGNVHLQPQGEIKITNMWGQERGFIPINQTSQVGIVLRESIRKFSFAWKGEWSISDIGRYKAVTTLAYGTESRQFVSAETTFWLIPYKLLLVIFLCLAIFVSLITWLVRIYVRHMLSMAGINIEDYQGAKKSKTLAINPKTKPKLQLHKPVQVGMLDLKQRISTATTFLGYIQILAKFIYQYRLFFFAVILIILFLIIVVWFLTNANTSQRSYEVVYKTPDSDVILTSEEIIYNQIKSENIVNDSKKSDPTLPKIKIINRSGIPGTGSRLKLRLESYGYEILSLEADFTTTQDRTVLIISPALEPEALQLSTILNKAPISTYAEKMSEDVITIYAGSDISKE